MNFSFPESMQVVQILEPGGTPEIRTMPVPRPGPGQVLIRIAAAPINPSDLARLKNSYVAPGAYPFVPGLEGSGRVVAAGPGLFSKLLVGKRVACAAAPNKDGTWAEYMTTSAMRCFPLLKTLSFEQGAMLIVNPLTALAFFDIAKHGKHAALVSNAAAGALGRMILRLAQKQDLPVIYIVRKPEQAELLRALGARYVLNCGDPDFPNRLNVLAQQLRATLILDPVGGQQTRLLLDAAPFGSTLLAYANLSGEPGSYTVLDLIGTDKKIQGFYFANWLAQKGLLQTLRDILKFGSWPIPICRPRFRSAFPYPPSPKPWNFTGTI